MSESEVILDGLFPLVILGRFLGCFTFTNIGQAKSTSELRLKILSLNLLLPIFIIAASVSCLVDAFINLEESTSTSNFKDSVVFAILIAYQIFGMAIVIHVNVKSSKIVDFLRQWSSVQDLLRCRKFFKRYGYFVTTCVLFLSAIYIPLHHSFYMGTQWTTTKTLRMLSLVMSTSVCFYFTGFVVYFTKAMQCCFIALEQDLMECLTLKNCCHLKLSLIRQRHELLVLLSQRFNSILSPILICFVVIQSTAACVSFYETMEFCLVQHSQSVFLSSRPATVGIMRFITIIAICVSGQMITQQASSAMRHLSLHPMHRLTADSKFQLELLRFQFQSRIPRISADGFLDLNNRLLGEIMGVMATYIIIMLELSQGRAP